MPHSSIIFFCQKISLWKDTLQTMTTCSNGISNGVNAFNYSWRVRDGEWYGGGRGWGNFRTPCAMQQTHNFDHIESTSVTFPWTFVSSAQKRATRVMAAKFPPTGKSGAKFLQTLVWPPVRVKEVDMEHAAEDERQPMRRSRRATKFEMSSAGAIPR